MQNKLGSEGNACWEAHDSVVRRLALVGNMRKSAQDFLMI